MNAKQKAEVLTLAATQATEVVEELGTTLGRRLAQYDANTQATARKESAAVIAEMQRHQNEWGESIVKNLRAAREEAAKDAAAVLLEVKRLVECVTDLLAEFRGKRMLSVDQTSDALAKVMAGLETRLATRANVQNAAVMAKLGEIEDERGREIQGLKDRIVELDDKARVTMGAALHLGHADIGGPDASGAHREERAATRRRRGLRPRAGAGLLRQGRGGDAAGARAVARPRRRGVDPAESRDPWAHRSAKMRCATCMWFVPKERVVIGAEGAVLKRESLPGPVGRCRRHAPTMSGYPVVFEHDWCGEHRLDEAKA